MNFLPSTNTLRPIIPDNARSLRITAAAGTKVSRSFFFELIIFFINEKTLQPIHKNESLMPSSFTQHYWIKLSLIVQNSPLLAISLNLLSVSMWLIILSDQLKIYGLLSFHLNNFLIFYNTILKQFLNFYEIFTINTTRKYYLF